MTDIPVMKTSGSDGNQAAFRRLMGRFATGVCVVATPYDGGGIAAMTVNSLVSVSLDPMLICWSVQNSASQFDVYANAQRFSVSVLGREQEELALRYAARGDSQLQASDFGKTAGGLPVIEGCIASLDCEFWDKHPAGDHTMILGKVSGFAPSGASNGDCRPLTFFNGGFCGIA